METKICKWCGKEYIGINRKFCSRACSSKARKNKNNYICLESITTSKDTVTEISEKNFSKRLNDGFKMLNGHSLDNIEYFPEEKE